MMRDAMRFKNLGAADISTSRPRNGWSSRVLASLLAYVLAGTQFAQANCFVQSDIQRVTPASWKVDMPSSCPTSNTQSTYLYYPQTNCTPLDLTMAMTSKW